MYAKNGRFGPYVQLGDADDAARREKPKMASLFQSMSLDTITLDDALRLLSLPRVVGVDDDGVEIVVAERPVRPVREEGRTRPAACGRGAAVHGHPRRGARRLRRSRSSSAAAGPLRRHRCASSGNDPDSGKPIVVKDGRFGPYVTDGETNASLRKGDTVEGITVERAAELLQIRRDTAPDQGEAGHQEGGREEEGAGEEGCGEEEGARQEGGGEEDRRQDRRQGRRRAGVAESARPAPVTSASVAEPASQRTSADPPPPHTEPASDDESAAAALAPHDPSDPSDRRNRPGSGPPASTCRSCPSAFLEEAVEPPAQVALHVRLFGSHAFFRLWIAQVVSALGDWLGFLAITILAASLGSGSGGAAVGLVMSARIIPGFFLAPVAGVLVDRWDRKKIMVTCDLGRALVICTLPFVHSVLGPRAGVARARDLHAHVVAGQGGVGPQPGADRPLDVSANSLSLAAAYGTFPIAAVLFALLAQVCRWLGDRRRAATSCRPTRRRSPSTSTWSRSSRRPS